MVAARTMIDDSVTVVRASALQRDGLAAFLAIAFVVALVRGIAGSQSRGGRVTVGVIFGALLVLLVIG